MVVRRLFHLRKIERDLVHAELGPSCVRASPIPIQQLFLKIGDEALHLIAPKIITVRAKVGSRLCRPSITALIRAGRGNRLQFSTGGCRP